MAFMKILAKTITIVIIVYLANVLLSINSISFFSVPNSLIGLIALFLFSLGQIGMIAYS
jgi:hypothetical protein